MNIMRAEIKDVPELLTVEELSQSLKLSKASIYTKVCRREIPHIKLGRILRFDREEISKWLDGQRVNGNNGTD